MASQPAVPPAIPVTPTEAEWRALSPAEREAFLVRVNAALSEAALLMGEGRPHWDAKLALLDALGLFFRTVGRSVYLAAEMSVLYPGEVAFCPDILAVADVPHTVDDQRMAWVVSDEGRGLDLAIEILHGGDRKKDLIDNVERYARLGIPEYLIFDRRDARVVAYRLTEAGGRRYQRIVPQHGRLRSNVLGLDFAVEEGRLKVFVGSSELFGSDELIGRLSGMLAAAQGATDTLRVEGEALRVEADRERERAELATQGLRAALIAALAARRLPASTETVALIERTSDVARLQGWLLRALVATNVDDVFVNDGEA